MLKQHEYKSTIFLQKTIFFVTIVVTLLIGSFGGIFIYEKYFDKEQSKNVETTETVVQKVDIKENDTIQPGVEKIYDAVVYIASYKNGNLYIMILSLSAHKVNQ